MKVLDLARRNRNEGPRRAANFERINQLLAMLGGKREEVRLFIMPPVVFADLVGDSISNYHPDIFPFGSLYTDVVHAFGRQVLVPPTPSVPTEDAGDYPVYEIVAIGGSEALIGRFNTEQDG